MTQSCQPQFLKWSFDANFRPQLLTSTPKSQPRNGYSAKKCLSEPPKSIQVNQTPSKCAQVTPTEITPTDLEPLTPNGDLSFNGKGLLETSPISSEPSPLDSPI